MKRKIHPAAKIISITFGAIIILAVLYILALCFPQPFFMFHTRYQNLRLYSDKPLPPVARNLLRQTQRRLLKSPPYDPNTAYGIFICNNPNLFMFFANSNYRVGGINYALFNRNTFIRKAHIKKNRLVGPSGHEVPGERTLVYYFTHEVTHGVTAQRIGNLAYFRLPVWIREGYADYVAKSTFDFKTNLKLFQAGVREMNPAKSGLYLRYHLMTAFMLDIKKATVNELLSGKFNQKSIETTLKSMKVD